MGKVSRDEKQSYTTEQWAHIERVRAFVEQEEAQRKTDKGKKHQQEMAAAEQASREQKKEALANKSTRPIYKFGRPLKNISTKPEMD